MTPYGLTIETALSGFEALDRLRGGSIYDIIFMDHMMPQMDGIETTKLIRESGYTQPIVALTANAVVGQAETFLASGFDDFVSKPIDIHQLNAVLNKFIRDKMPPIIVEAARRRQFYVSPNTERDAENLTDEDDADCLGEQLSRII
jgi:CheY-like chemotaxis protein